MGCAFCASTLGGLVRRLEPFEMLDQVLFTQVDSGLPISHIVLMGIGEPLDNFDNVMRFLELVNSEEGMNISMRHISLSTCGLVPKIDALAAKKAEAAERLTVETVENDWYITSSHAMTKEDYISFVAFQTGDRVQLVKQYPEWNLQVRTERLGHGMLLWYSAKEGLLYQLV